MFDPLFAISPVDGRYRSKTESLVHYFSESALIRYRIQIEIEYFLLLAQAGLPQFSGFPMEKAAMLRSLYQNFTEADAKAVKEIEKVTNHDVKAVEYFIKDRLKNEGLDRYLEFIHFGLTSQDINNTAIPLSLKEAMEVVYLPQLQNLLGILKKLSNDWKDIPMLARTHGQPASPTRLGKEFMVFVVRLEAQLHSLSQIPNAAKFGGATGNMNAHVVCYPEVDWNAFARRFVESFGLTRSYPTTQIEHYDHLAAQMDALKRINNILIDLCRDVWMYVSMDYFKQKIKEGEVGSSAMPHKVNPIDFENAEGNLGIANALYEHLSAKLPISRLQRDLTDSTVMRNIGVPLAHSLMSFQAIEKGLGKLLLNEKRLSDDLEANWAVVAEAIQNILRREGFPKPYEALKALTRTNEAITKDSIHRFINELEVNENIKAELMKISPWNYLGV
jgi:adenylosuccinate lyase